MTSEQRAARAVAVNQLLNDDNVKAALASIEDDLKDEWKRCHSPAERENLWLALNVMDRLIIWLRSAASHDLTALKRVR